MGIHASNSQSTCEPGQSGSSTVNWGSILGTITDQADLIAYLEANYSGNPSATTPDEEDIVGTAIELDETNINGSGEIVLDLTAFVSCRIHIDSDDAEIVDTTGRPASGESFTRYYTLTTENGTEAYTLPVAWIIMGQDLDATEINCLAVEYSNFPSEGLKIRAYNTYEP